MNQLGIAVVFAGLGVLFALHRFYEHFGVCVQCGGRGAHRDGCPEKRN